MIIKRENAWKERVIWRNLNRTEEDDFKLNVESRLSLLTEAVPVYFEDSVIFDEKEQKTKPKIAGWKIQLRGE